MTDPGSVHAAAASVEGRFERLDVLINNAGHTHTERTLSCLGIELGWHVSSLGHFQLTKLLLPMLQRATSARVVNLAGLYHRKGHHRLDDLPWHERRWDWAQAGCDAQLARVMFTLELADRLRHTQVTVNAVHPGAVRIHAQDVMPAHMRLLMDTVMRVAFVSPRRGARPILRLVEGLDLADVSGTWCRRHHPAQVHPLALDPGARVELWQHSQRLLGH